ncbi:hypothetical protein FUT69_07120 [Xylella taiwanensis]|uniref:Uncharacterized protein n=1 Tax=Xylella taiwanensis TaxID=1444770 RepID=Z9JI52_9GAMM|nr:hypothetical protein [Xylella taiwanensis]AXI82546.1 hypothetical protein AB672_00405 [Xylella taiwanensis]EWS77688.1 hypothetical protein AF72_09685 [Xylella taiwanensis]MCD8455535.1 hypothetical protein [Xylella taiwanensis]MCD8457943.1 hypothetical protein [Xylella taiwanensis]MCD8460077.1 hypothetical protein [Xylella taiwanensis]
MLEIIQDKTALPEASYPFDDASIDALSRWYLGGIHLHMANDFGGCTWNHVEFVQCRCSVVKELL